MYQKYFLLHNPSALITATTCWTQLEKILVQKMYHAKQILKYAGQTLAHCANNNTWVNKLLRLKKKVLPKERIVGKDLLARKHGPQ